MDRSEFENLVKETRDILGEEYSAKISENLINILNGFVENLETISDITKENEKLKQDNEALLLTNGRLFQKISFEKEEPKKEEEKEELKIEDIINEKGELI